MNPQEALKETLEGLKPMLDAAGRSIEVTEATDASCTVVLKGFCGDCACTASYVEGIQEILAEKSPAVKDVRFIQA
jgi:Fe-S cluster biogenesis protein NfuA